MAPALVGLIGGIPAALLAAWVANSVLKRSNRKQQKLVDQQLATQRTEVGEARRSVILADSLSAAANGLFRALVFLQERKHKPIASRSALSQLRVGE